ALLINLIPQIRLVLVGELAPPEGESAPSLFLFDIQDEQREPLVADLESLGLKLDYLSPMITARLDSLNGEEVQPENDDAVAVSREEQRSSRMRNRTYNLSYRQERSSSEALVDGRPIAGPYRWEDTAIAGEGSP